MLERVTGDAVVSFEAERRRLFGLAYRLLGSAADAEDVLQDAFLRWSDTDRAAVAEPAAWLTTTVTNLCLTFLSSARQRRERYVGAWLPEPVLTGTGNGLLGPLETAVQRESVSMALLMLYERLTAPERAVLILHEAFGYRYQEIAQIIGRSEGACRQLRRRAAERLGPAGQLGGPPSASRPDRDAGRRASLGASRDPGDGADGGADGARDRYMDSAGWRADSPGWRRLVGQFFAAASAGDVAGLERLLADDVVYWSDGGGKVPAALRPVRGRAKVARLFSGVLSKVRPWAEVSVAEVNASPALLAWNGDELLGIVIPEISASGITSFYTIMNPDKLRRAARQGAGLPRMADLPG
jgi:RNA polymerase sigma-70 factor (ECF subfamily)